jgi:leader peptidase (prepilin peptidase)/N-methyltransferase
MAVEGGWFIYFLHLVMVAGFIAASAIDLEFWVIPLSICWFITLAGLIGSAVGSYIVHPSLIHPYHFLLPQATARSGAMAVGAASGLGISWLLLITGVFKRSYDVQMSQAKCETGGIDLPQGGADLQDKQGGELRFNHRLESLREIVFLAPIIICSVAALWVSRNLGPVRSWWIGVMQYPAVVGLLGSLWGYFVGCGVVWATRILGTLAFGKEAMGLGDVHLMGAAGAIVGPVSVVLAFFIAPFFGLAWVCFQMFFRKIRQIPYGPFLSLGVVTVMILYDWILSQFGFVFYCS